MTVWALSGHDPSGGAGLLADARAAASFGVPLRSILTCHTAQNDRSAYATKAASVDWLALQWQALAAQESPSAIKVGLLLDEASIRFLGDRSPGCPWIVDPVLALSSGTDLSSSSMISAFKEFIWPKTSLLTPNRPEAERLVGFSISTLGDVQRAATELRKQGLGAVLIKGGHAERAELFDYFDDGHRPFILKADRIEGNYRGTGCTLSSAIACALAQGHTLREAVILGHSFVQAAIRNAFAAHQNHLPVVQTDPEFSSLFYNEPFTVKFPRLARPLGFYAVAPDAHWVERLALAQVPTLQLRAKAFSKEALHQEIRTAKAACERSGAYFFLNDDWQAALVHQTFGLHLGQEDLDYLRPSQLRELAAAQIHLGISTHSIEEAARAKALNPSYIALGPVFETTCKSMRFGPQGIDKVGVWVRRLGSIPVVAIGGLKRDHAEALLAQGADGIAVISDVLSASSPESRVNEWLKAWPS
jgi:hydroxymethylpyrimidine kinase/phosphomethylpyrimidine kinase/thiamine-phosphate diphosphorylase